MAALREVLGWMLAGAGRFAHEDPEGVVARAKGYGLEGHWTRDMEDRLAGWKAEHGEEAEPPLPQVGHPGQALRLLIMGGDERPGPAPLHANRVRPVAQEGHRPALVACPGVGGQVVRRVRKVAGLAGGAS